MSEDPHLDQALIDLANPVVENRLAAIQTLGDNRDVRAIPKLFPLLSDADDRIRATAMDALSTMDRLALFDGVLDYAAQLTGAERGFIALKNPATHDIDFVAWHEMDREEGEQNRLYIDAVIAEAVASRKPIMKYDPPGDSTQSSKPLTTVPLRRVLAMPLLVDGDAIGVIYCDKRVRSGTMMPQQMDALATFANRVAPLFAPLSSSADAKAAELDDFIVMRDEKVSFGAETQAAGGGLAALPSDGTPTKPLHPLPTVPSTQSAVQTEANQPSPPPPLSSSGTSARPEPVPQAEAEAVESTASPAPGGEPSKDASAPPAGNVQFSAYYPKTIKPDDWQPFHAYVFRDTVASAVVADAFKALGDKQAGFSAVTTPARVAVNEGAEIVARPSMPGFQFNPLTVTMGFYDDWARFDFKLRAKDAPLHQFAVGSITFTVEGLIVADVPLSIYVGDGTSSEINNAVVKMYQTIFCSYSHKDMQIVERVERAYKALGLDYLRDIQALKSGQEWDEQLLKLIDRADIFQLFWSQAAAASPYVEKEWRYALQYENARAGFIRPVWWKEPMPPVPKELERIHFAYEPGLDE